MKHSIVISRLTSDDGSYLWGRSERYGEYEVGDIRLNQMSSDRQLTLRGYTLGKETDDDDDVCCLVSIEVFEAHVSTVLYPSLIITGYAESIRASDAVRPDGRGGWRYVPEKNDDWNPGLIEVRIYGSSEDDSN